jgi:hypothetical protein
MNISPKKRSHASKNINTKRRRSNKSLLEQQVAMLKPNATGTEVASAAHWVCVPADRGLEVCLVNACYVKNAPGRTETDREDCQWIQR